MKKPTFFIVGAPRTGTTAMYEFLKEHPQIFMTVHKEPHYFATDIKARNPWMKSLRIKRNYLKLFSEAKKEKELGEASVLYMLSRKAAGNIKKFNPDAKIIIMLRSPLEVMHSLFYQLYFGGDENISNFKEALRAEHDRKRGKRLPLSPRMKQFYFYREIAKFSVQLKRYFKYFDNNRIKIIVYEDFKKHPKIVYKEVLKFLGVDSDFKPTFRTVNPNRSHKFKKIQFLMSQTAFFLSRFGFDLYISLRPVYRWIEKKNLKVIKRPPIDPKLMAQLKREFRNEVKDVSKIIGRDVTYWVK